MALQPYTNYFEGNYDNKLPLSIKRKHGLNFGFSEVQEN
jgi:hypothetical protein